MNSHFIVYLERKLLNSKHRRYMWKAVYTISIKANLMDSCPPPLFLKAHWLAVWIVLFESPLDCRKIQPVHPKGDQSSVFIGGTDVEAETPILWPPDAKSWLIGKDPDAGRDWGQEEKGTKKDEMAGWHYRLDEHVFG